MEIEERIAARGVARMIGVRTATLAKWRRLGKGPRGWREISPTLVKYPAAEVQRFIAERKSIDSANQN